MRSTPPRSRSVVSLVLAISVVGGLAVLASADEERAGGQYRPVHPHAYPINLPEGTPVRSGVPISTHLRILDDEDPVYRLYALNEIARFSTLGAYEERVRARVEALAAEELSSAVRLAALRAVGRWSPEQAIRQSERIIRDGDASSGLRVGAWVVGMEHDAERFEPMLVALADSDSSPSRQRVLWWASTRVLPEIAIEASVIAMERSSPSTNIEDGLRPPGTASTTRVSLYSDFRQWELLFNALTRGMDRLEHPMPTELSERLGRVMAERLKAHLTHFRIQRPYTDLRGRATLDDYRESLQAFMAGELEPVDPIGRTSPRFSYASSLMDTVSIGSTKQIYWVFDRDPVAYATAEGVIREWNFDSPMPTHENAALEEREQARWRESSEQRREVAELLWNGFQAAFDRGVVPDWQPIDATIERIGIDDIVAPENLLSRDERRFYDALIAPPER